LRRGGVEEGRGWYTYCGWYKQKRFMHPWAPYGEKGVHVVRL